MEQSTFDDIASNAFQGRFMVETRAMQLESIITSRGMSQGNTSKQSIDFKGSKNSPLLYLKLKIEGCNLFSDIKQVVIDEAQDYCLMQYEVFKLLFKGAKYTVLGDIHQPIEREADSSLYDDISEILKKPKTIKLFLNKGYRSSYEISAFTQRLLGSYCM